MFRGSWERSGQVLRCSWTLPLWENLSLLRGQGDICGQAIWKPPFQPKGMLSPQSHPFTAVLLPFFVIIALAGPAGKAEHGHASQQAAKVQR